MADAKLASKLIDCAKRRDVVHLQSLLDNNASSSRAVNARPSDLQFQPLIVAIAFGSVDCGARKRTIPQVSRSLWRYAGYALPLPFYEFLLSPS